MPKILILGAYGQIARVATDLFLKQADARLTLYLRKAKRLKLSGYADRVRVAGGAYMPLFGMCAAFGRLPGDYKRFLHPVRRKYKSRREFSDWAIKEQGLGVGGNKGDRCQVSGAGGLVATA